jgi:transposase
METLGRKRFRSREERRQIVEETLKPGESVSLVARAHDVNANQVFHCRKLYREGWFGDAAAAQSDALLPVKISTTSQKHTNPVQPIKKTGKRNEPGTIQIGWDSIRVRIDRAADPDCVRAVLDGLMRRLDSRPALRFGSFPKLNLLGREVQSRQKAVINDIAPLCWRAACYANANY